MGIDPLADPLSLFLVQTCIIIGVTRSLSLLGQYFKQPRIIFEVIGGILLGPSALGRTKFFTSTIFKPSSMGHLNVIANFGLVFYLFVVGMELDPKLLITHYRKAGGVAIVGMIVPFGLGIAISRTLYDNLLDSTVQPSFTVSNISLSATLSTPQF